MLLCKIRSFIRLTLFCQKLSIICSPTMLSSNPVRSHPSPAPVRRSPQVTGLRRSHPYSNHSSTKKQPPAHSPSTSQSHAHPPTTYGPPPEPEWCGPRGYGLRHRLDDAPFSLWDETTGDFRNPTREEFMWFNDKFHAKTISVKRKVFLKDVRFTPDTSSPTRRAKIQQTIMISIPRSTQTYVCHRQQQRMMGPPRQVRCPPLRVSYFEITGATSD